MYKLLLAFPAAFLIVGSAHAQVFETNDNTEDTIDGLETTISDEFEKSQRPSFGQGYRRLGWTGSVAASANATSGNTDTSDIGIGARLGYGTADWKHEFSLAYTFGESDDVQDTNRFLGSYDASRYFNDRFFAYGDVRYAYDDFGAYQEDLFVGVGLGYQLINTTSTAWSVQAGPGYRRLEDFNGQSETEAAASLSSKLWWKISDTAILNNDTDIIFSDTDTAISNDLGVNFTLSGPLSLRTSLLTEYHTDPVGGRASTDNALGMSLIYTFN